MCNTVVFEAVLNNTLLVCLPSQVSSQITSETQFLCFYFCIYFTRKRL